jgi:hypothetical protein
MCSGCGAAYWRNWFGQQIEIRFVPSIETSAPARDPADNGMPRRNRRASQVSIVFVRQTQSRRRPRTVAQAVKIRFPFVSKNWTSVVPVTSSGSPISNVFAILCVAVQTPAGLNRKAAVTAVNV